MVALAGKPETKADALSTQLKKAGARLEKRIDEDTTHVLVGLRPVERSLLAKRRRVHATLRVKAGISFDPYEKIIQSNGIHVYSRRTFEHDSDRTFELELIGATKQFDVMCDLLRTAPDVISMTTE